MNLVEFWCWLVGHKFRTLPKDSPWQSLNQTLQCRRCGGLDLRHRIREKDKIIDN